VQSGTSHRLRTMMSDANGYALAKGSCDCMGMCQVISYDSFCKQHRHIL
jgi:hypothetical protein